MTVALDSNSSSELQNHCAYIVGIFLLVRPGCLSLFQVSNGFDVVGLWKHIQGGDGV